MFVWPCLLWFLVNVDQRGMAAQHTQWTFMDILVLGLSPVSLAWFTVTVLLPTFHMLCNPISPSLFLLVSPMTAYHLCKQYFLSTFC